MDRFIVNCQKYQTLIQFYLKSNMDRFIVLENLLLYIFTLYLKSNMDRFIAETYFAEIEHREI